MCLCCDQIELRKFKDDVAVRAEKWSAVVPTPEEARRAFERIDTDGSGTLDREEITTVLTQEFGLTLTDDELEDAFAELDVDGDGQIDEEEFVNGMCNLRRRDTMQKRTARVLASRQKRRDQVGLTLQFTSNCVLVHLQLCCN